MQTVLEVLKLRKHYDIKKSKKVVKALDDVSFSLKENMTIGIVGESGCGKSTLAKTLMGLETKTEGDIVFSGKSVDQMKLKDRFKHIQMVFQDPMDSLNPRKKAWEIIADPLLINTKCSKEEAYNKACELMATVGLRAEGAHKYPHMFSGGQRQRLGIARALILNPKILILDEPVSALDVSIQAQILNLLKELQKKIGLSYIFITHDLSVVNYIADEILVMYLGKVCEYGKTEDIFKNPKHPYTKTLLKSAHASNNPEVLNFPKLQDTELPSPLNPPSGCSFHTRCPLVRDECMREIPPLKNNVRCIL